MNFPGTVDEAKQFFRVLREAFEKVSKDNPNKKWNFMFAMALEKPDIEKSDTDIKSRLMACSDIMRRLNPSDKVNIRVDVSEYGGVDAQILQETEKGYAAAEALKADLEQGQKNSTSEIASAIKEKAGS